jgi:lysophospholipase L1-like esterase
MPAPRNHVPGSTSPPQLKVALLGDSVIAGLGVHGRSYGRIVAEELGASQVLRLARSTHTILNAVGHLGRLREYEPDLVIVSVGGSDCIVHAGRAVQNLLDRFAPKSWKGIEGLEPRPWFSGEKAERGRQRVTGTVKLVVKRVGIALTGGYRRVPPVQFEPALQELLAALDGIGCIVAMVSLHEVDDRLWPRSNASAREYNATTRAHLATYPRVVYLDPNPLLRRWEDFCADHAHLNEHGHARVASMLLDALSSVSPNVHVP